MQLSGGSLLALLGREAATALGSSPRPDGGQGQAASAARQYAMVIDSRKCRQRPGCTKCLDACHQAHNVPYIEDPGRKVDWIWEAPAQDVFSGQQSPYIQITLKNEPVPVLCNHCEYPPCVRVCPTGATWKRETDGIVMMDWHRCIGCKYCIVACPYGARSFNFLDPRPYIKHLNAEFPTRREGVVEKCNFCAERLAEGKLPACVEACPENAMIFGDITDFHSEISKLLRARDTIRRKPELGTQPNVFYIV